MNCSTAQHLIDLRVHHADGPPPAGLDLAALDRHLAGCAACRADLDRLMSTRALLRGAASESPTPAEIKSMWTAIEAEAFLPAASPPAWLGRMRVMAGYAAACIGAAVLLLVAQQLGQVRYEGRSSVAGLLATGLGSLSSLEARERFSAVDGKLTVPESSVAASYDEPLPSTDLYAAEPVTDEATAEGRWYGRFATGTELSESARTGSRDTATYGMLGDVAGAPPVAADRGAVVDARLKDLADQTWDFAENKPTGADSPTSSTKATASAGRGFAFKADGQDAEGAAQPGEVFYAFNSTGPAPDSTMLGLPALQPDQAGKAVLRLEPAASSTTGGVAMGGRFTPANGAAGRSEDRPEILAGSPLTTTTVDAIDWDPTEELAFVESDATYGKSVDDDPILGSRHLVARSLLDAAPAVSAGQSLTLFGTDEGAPVQWDIVMLGEELKSVELARLDRNRPEIGLVQAPRTAASQPAPPPPPPGPDGAPAIRGENRPKVIKTAEITVEVPEYAPAVAAARRIVEELGGFVADGSTAELSGGALSGKLVARMPPERFDAIYNALKTVGRVEKEDARSADVTAEYVDLAARIESALITEERLQKLITEKSFLDEVTALLEVERELQRVRTQIEQMQGSLRVMDNRIALSTITLHLHEPPRTVPTAKLMIEVGTVEAGAQAVQRLLADVSGRMIRGEIKKSENGTLMGGYGLSVTLDRFPELLAGLRGLGRVAVSNVTGFKEGDAAAAWATRVTCEITLDLFERARQLPSGVMTIEVDVAGDALAALEPLLPEHRASIITSTTQRRDDGSQQKEMQIRVPAATFGELIRTIEGSDSIGRVVVKNTAGEIGSIVGGAADVLCDLTLTLAEKSRQLPSGTMRIEVDSTPAAVGRLDAVLGEVGASIVSNVTRRRDDGSTEAELRLTVPAGRYSALLAGLAAEGALGRTIDQNTSGEVGEITGGAAETPCPLTLTLAERVKQVPAGKMVLEVEKFDPARQQLSALVAEKKLQVLAAGSDQRTDGTWIGGFRLGIRAAEMDAVVTRLEGLGLVRSRQISGLNLGDLTTIDPATIGVIEVTLAEKAAIAPPTEKAGGAFRQRVREALEGLWGSLGMIAYGLIVMLPWLLIGGAAIWVVARSRRRSRAAAAPAATESQS